MRVLIVDDTHTLRSLIQVYLVAQGWEFVEARDGAEVEAVPVERTHRHVADAPFGRRAMP